MTAAEDRPALPAAAALCQAAIDCTRGATLITNRSCVQPVAGHQSGPFLTPLFFPSHCALTQGLHLTIFNTISKGKR